MADDRHPSRSGRTISDPGSLGRPSPGSLQNMRRLESVGAQLDSIGLNRPAFVFNSAGHSSSCATAVMVCQLKESAPVGSLLVQHTAWCCYRLLIPNDTKRHTKITPPPPQANACKTRSGSCLLSNSSLSTAGKPREESLRSSRFIRDFGTVSMRAKIEPATSTTPGQPPSNFVSRRGKES